MMQARRWSPGKLTAGVVLAASLALAACGSDGNPTSTTTTAAAAATTTAAAAAATTTTVAATTTTSAFTDGVLKEIAGLKDCDTLKTLITITNGELASASASNKKLYEDRIAAAQAQQKTLSCPAS